MNSSKIAATAKALGISEAQVREVLESAGSQVGTWATTTNGIVTHTDGSRHWSSATCEQCS